MRRTFGVRAWLTLAVCGAAWVAIRAQAPPAFRAGVELVSVDVSVLDNYRLPIRGLTPEDFTVLEDGRPRPVAAFSPVDLPTAVLPSARWMLDVAPDVATNALAPEGRLVAILIDRSIPLALSPTARRIAHATVDALGPADMGAVIFTARGIPQDFTSDRRSLTAALDRPFMGLPEGDDGTPADCQCGLCSLDAMRLVADSVRDVPRRRKLLVYIGTNVPVDDASPVCGTLVSDSREKLIKSAQVANLTIHTIDPSGLQTLAPGPSVQGTPPPDPIKLLMARQANLGVYPSHTGGRAIVNVNEPEDDLRAVLRESGSYYVLGFPPAEARADGRFHRIEVRVNRRGATVQARQGYYESGGRAAPPLLTRLPAGLPVSLVDALSSLWPRMDLPLDLSVAAFETPGRSHEATIAIAVGVRPPPDPSGAPGASVVPPAGPRRVTVLAGAFDRNGKALNYARQSLAVQVPDAYDAMARFTLAPGRYEIRTAVEDDGFGRSGSVYMYLDVPAFRGKLLTASGLVLEATPARATAPRDAFADLLPVVPSARREFARTDRVTAFERFYLAGDSVVPVRVSAQVVDTADTRVFGRELSLAPDRFDASRAADFVLDLPVASLAPGEYLLSIDATRANVTETRTARFSVR